MILPRGVICEEKCKIKFLPSPGEVLKGLLHKGVLINSVMQLTENGNWKLLST